MNLSITSLAVAFVIRAIFIAPKMIYFKNCLTMGEVMGDLYGKGARVTTGLLGFFNATILASIQLMALGMIGASLLGIKPIWGTLIGGSIMIVYASIGGMKAVTVTDVIQFFMLIVAVPMIAYVAVYHIGGIKALFSKVPSEKFVVLGHQRFNRYLLYFVIWLLQMGMIDPAVVQRMLMAKNKFQLRNQYLIIAVFDPVFRFIVMLIGLAGVVLYPSIEGNNVVLHIIQELLPVGLKGLAIAGLLAVVMSSADAYLHVASLTLVHDVIAPYCKSNAFNELYWVRYATVFVGLFALMMGIKIVPISYLGFKALEVIAPMLLFPFIGGVMGIKPDKGSFVASLLVTCITFIASNLWLPLAYDLLPMLISTLANGITFFGLHYILNKGFKMVNRSVIKPIADFQSPNGHSAFASRASIFTPQKILLYFQNRVRRYGAPYILSGLFCFLSLIVPYLIAPQPIGKHQGGLFIFRFIGAVFSFILIIKDRWNQNFQDKYLPIFFHFTLFYCLVCLNILVVLVAQGDIFWLINMVLSLIFFMALVDWFSMVVLSTLGMALGLLFMGYFMPLTWCLYSCSLIGYPVIMGLLIGWVFMYRKQKQVDQLETQGQQLTSMHALSESDRLCSLQYQIVQKEFLMNQKVPLQNVKKVLNCLTEKVLDDKKAIQKAVEQLDAFTTYCKNSFYYSMDYLRLNVGPIEVNKLLSKVAQSLWHLGVADRVEVQLDTRQSLIYCDGEKIVQLLVNSIGQIQSASTCVLLILSVQDTALHYHFQAVTDENYKRELAALGFVLTTESKALTLQPSYQGSTKASQISVPENIADLVQRKNERILDAHYGYSEVAMTASGQQLLYIIPVDLRAIRSKVVDEVPLLGKGLLETEYSLAIERTFLTKLQEKATLDLDIAQEAIAQVKRMHQGQFRKSGELFYTHPLTVATILLDMTQDPDAIVAALLHDIVEDTPLSLDQVTYQYGKEVAYMVSKLTCLDFTIRKTKLTNREYQQQLTLYHDTRVVMVKLADRLHNVRTLAFHSQEKQKRIAQETLTFYVPLGRKLKLDAVDQVVNELEIRCKKIINSLNRKLKDG